MKINQLITGWVQYFKYGEMKTIMNRIDEWTRRRLRAIRWKEWKKVRTKQKNLMKLGINKRKAWEWANTRKSYWRIAFSWILTKTLNNQYWYDEGYKGFWKYYNFVRNNI